jgi:hypothetical protein
VQDSKTAIVAGIKQETKGDTRASIPVLGMLPILGRFITTPRQSSSLSDIIITVTPHIMRAAELRQEDHLARLGGSQIGGVKPSIEDLVARAQAEDDEERLAILRQRQASMNPPGRALAAAPPESLQRSAKETDHNAALIQPVKNSSAAALVTLSLTPEIIKPQVGESFLVAALSSGSLAITGGTIALKFDPRLLQFRSVHTGGQPGAPARLSHQVEGGKLLIKLPPATGPLAPGAAKAQLFLIEFTALDAGQAVLDFDLNETTLVIDSQTGAQTGAQSALVNISRKDPNLK